MNSSCMIPVEVRPLYFFQCHGDLYFNSHTAITADHLDMISGHRAHEEHSQWAMGTSTVVDASPKSLSSQGSGELRKEKGGVVHIEEA